MKKEELKTIQQANCSLWTLATVLDKRNEIEGTQYDKIIVDLLKNITFLLDTVENLEKSKPF